MQDWFGRIGTQMTACLQGELAHASVLDISGVETVWKAIKQRVPQIMSTQHCAGWPPHPIVALNFDSSRSHASRA